MFILVRIKLDTGAKIVIFASGVRSGRLMYFLLQLEGNIQSD